MNANNALPDYRELIQQAVSSVPTSISDDWRLAAFQQVLIDMMERQPGYKGSIVNMPNVEHVTVEAHAVGMNSIIGLRESANELCEAQAKKYGGGHCKGCRCD